MYLFITITNIKYYGNVSTCRDVIIPVIDQIETHKVYQHYLVSSFRSGLLTLVLTWYVFLNVSLYGGPPFINEHLVHGFVLRLKTCFVSRAEVGGRLEK